MRSYFVSALLLSFVVIAVFGFAMMGPDNNHMGCIAAIAQGVTDCPGAFGMALLHLNTFKMFSSVVFGQNVLPLAFIFFLFLFIFLILDSRFAPLPISDDFRRKYYFELPCPNFSNWLNHWLSLHENSPAVP